MRRLLIELAQALCWVAAAFLVAYGIIIFLYT